MIPLWRVVRNRHTRRLYDRLSESGVTVARMVEYEADLADLSHRDGDGDAGTVPADVSFEHGKATADPIQALDLDFALPVTFLDEEWVVAATAGGEAVGRALVSAGQRPPVEPLGTGLSFDGAYVRRVYVAPEWRNRGLARRLVGETLPLADQALGADTAHALIAPDNRPSRRAFEAHGFEPVRHHDYLGLFGREWRRVREL